jgi:hypothetical protein
MTPGQEAILSLYGAWRFAHGDAKAIAYFNDSIAGFWRSFTAALIVAPLYGLLLLVRHQGAMAHVPGVRFAAIEMIAYAIAWLAFPVLMASFVKTLDRNRFYVRYIVVYNWTAVLQNGLYLPIAILAAADLIGNAVANTLGIIALGVVVVYVWFVARVALEISPAQAAGVISLDFLLSILINAVAEGMLR